MNRKYRLSTLFMVCLMLFSCFTITACDDGEDENTNQYKGGLNLNVFGPSPVMRGGILRFLGSNLEQVTGVVIPGCEKITDIEIVTRGTYSEIRVQVPVEGPVEGYVELYSSKGNPIITKTPLTYSEPIVFASFAPESVKVGSSITITGDYLNNVHEVIFAGDAVVSETEFTKHTRYEIEVAVPVTATSGKVILSDGAEIPNWIYSEKELTVVLPTITGVSETTVKGGNTFIVSGTDLLMVESVVFGGEKSVADTLFIERTNEEIKLEMPKDIQNGVIKLVTYAGDVVEGVELTTVVPSCTSISGTQKNGNTIELSGTNLDLVTKVSFQIFDGTLVDGEEFTYQSGKITVKIPEAAVSGKLTLTAASTETVESLSVTLAEPKITGTYTVSAGDNIELKGTDLDLISSVELKDCSSKFIFTVNGATSVNFSTEYTAPVGTYEISLKTKNGCTVLSNVMTVKATSKAYITEFPDAFVANLAVMMKGVNLSTVTAVSIGGKSVVFSVKGEYIYVAVPNIKAGIYDMQLTNGAGTSTISIKTIEGLTTTDRITENTIMISNFDGGDNTQSGLDWGGDAIISYGIPSVDLDGSLCMMGKTYSGSWCWMWATNWGALPSLADASKYVLKIDYCVTKAVDPGMKLYMLIGGWDGKNIEIGDFFTKVTEGGKWYTLSVEIGGGEIAASGDWGLYMSGAEGIYDFSGVMIDNLRFDPK